MASSATLSCAAAVALAAGSSAAGALLGSVCFCRGKTKRL